MIVKTLPMVLLQLYPVLEAHDQDEHLRQQQELHLLAEGGVSAPGGRELEPDGANHSPYPRHRSLEPGTQGLALH